MKKNILILFLLSILVLPNWSFAQEGDFDPDPIQSDCVILENNLRYRDRDTYKDGEVSTLQDFLQAKGYLENEPTGYFGLLTLRAVKKFQRENGINPTGYVGSITRNKISNLGCDFVAPIPCPDYNLPFCPDGKIAFSTGQDKNGCGLPPRCVYPNEKPPIISGVSGPQTLSINEIGTWKVSASDSNGGNLSYSVDWGDQIYPAYTTESSGAMRLKQTATFTHTYLEIGTYTATFTVTNDSGQSVSVSLTVNVRQNWWSY